VAARGLDVEHISHVVNFDPPADDKAYVHRVGRTARAGRGGTGVTFVTPDQQADMSKMADALDLRVEFADAGMGRVRPVRPAAGGRPRLSAQQSARRRRRRY
jgi:superfamily II DNA/RNA helicase